jgi:hypothetical protein
VRHGRIPHGMRPWRVRPHQQHEGEAIHGLPLLAGKDLSMPLDRRGDRLGNHRIVDAEIASLPDE